MRIRADLSASHRQAADGAARVTRVDVQRLLLLSHRPCGAAPWRSPEIGRLGSPLCRRHPLARRWPDVPVRATIVDRHVRCTSQPTPDRSPLDTARRAGRRTAAVLEPAPTLETPASRTFTSTINDRIRGPTRSTLRKDCRSISATTTVRRCPKGVWKSTPPPDAPSLPGPSCSTADRTNNRSKRDGCEVRLIDGALGGSLQRRPLSALRMWRWTLETDRSRERARTRRGIG